MQLGHYGLFMCPIEDLDRQRKEITPPYTGRIVFVGTSHRR